MVHNKLRVYFYKKINTLNFFKKVSVIQKIFEDIL
jgi:hypothetical protein